MPSNEIRDESSDKKYFLITPQLVWARSRSPYDYTLWNVIKMITGEKGKCFLSTEDLAILAMMSAGKVSECRTFLIEEGLLKGEIRRDPGFPQAVWHLEIPDLWQKNVQWRQEFETLSDRIQLKKAQKEKSLHLVKASPDEGCPSPDEGKPSPGETKKNQQEEPTEQPLDAVGALLSEFGIQDPMLTKLVELGLDEAVVKEWIAYAQARNLGPGFVINKLRAGSSPPQQQNGKKRWFTDEEYEECFVQPEEE